MNRNTLLAILHVPYEKPAMILDWAHASGIRVEIWHAYKDPIPQKDYDGLLVMGGPMGVHDQDRHRFLIDEFRLIENYLRLQKPIFGVCLGAQILAHLLGADIKTNRFKEIGFWPVSFYRYRNVFKDEVLLAFHWHGDTFSLPAGATRLASNDLCENQAFIYEDRAIGLQFHLEMRAENIDELLHHGQEELDSPSIGVQSKETIESFLKARTFAQQEEQRKKWLDWLLHYLFRVFFDG